MEVSMEMHQLKKLMSDAAELGANKALVESGVLKPYLTQAAAWRKYGRGQVERWVKEGLIVPRKDGPRTAMVRFDRVILETIAMSSNRHCYLSVAERSAK